MQTVAQLGRDTSYVPEGLDASDFEIYVPPAPAAAPPANTEAETGAQPVESPAEAQPAAA